MKFISLLALVALHSSLASASPNPGAGENAKAYFQNVHSQDQIVFLLAWANAPAASIQTVMKEMQKSTSPKTFNFDLVGNTIYAEHQSTGIQIVSYSPLKITYRKKKWVYEKKNSLEDNFSALEKILQTTATHTTSILDLFAKPAWSADVAGYTGSAVAGGLTSGILTTFAINNAETYTFAEANQMFFKSLGSGALEGMALYYLIKQNYKNTVNDAANAYHDIAAIVAPGKIQVTCDKKKVTISILSLDRRRSSSFELDRTGDGSTKLYGGGILRSSGGKESRMLLQDVPPEQKMAFDVLAACDNQPEADAISARLTNVRSKVSGFNQSAAELPTDKEVETPDSSSIPAQ